MQELTVFTIFRKEDKTKTMKILLSIDTDKNINCLGERLSKVLNIFDEDLYYIDILHAYQKPQADAPHLPFTMTEIIKDERKQKIKFIADCQHLIGELLEDKLHKSALVNSYLKEGKFFKEFQNQINETEYDLIVLLPDKKDKLDTFLQGRNITKIIAKHNAPILVLPKLEKMPMDDTNFIAMIEDSKKAFKKMKKLNVIKQIKPDCLKYYHISKYKEEENEGIQIIQSKDIMSGFENLHNKRKANHIYIVKHKRKQGINKFLQSSFTKSVLNKTDASLMIL